MVPPPENRPRHVAIIMDGNGRWAQARGFSRIEGHRQGGENIRSILEACIDLGIPYLTLYAFSVENWKRPKAEVSALMQLLVRFLKRETRELAEKGIRLRVIGRLQELPARPRRALEQSMERTASGTTGTLVLALNYGSRTEIVDAARAFAAAVARGETDPDTCNWETFRRFLYDPDLPDPDLIIRTSGETRLSNFLMLQGAYSELYFSPVCWPDFDREQLEKAIACYSRRERRYGQTGEQLKDKASAALPQT